MGKIAEIIESGKAPGFDQKQKSERDPDRAVPRAFKSLSNDQVRKFTRESGFSVDHVKRVWEMAVAGLLCLWLTFGALAADINKGYSFTPTDRVTNTKLNNLVDAATINTTFFTDKSSGTPAAADTFLLARSGNFYRATFASMVRDYTGLITEQSEDTTPATGDFVLTYDISATSYKKVQLMSLWTNDFLINGRAALTNVTGATLLLGYDPATGAYGKTTVSNLTQQLYGFLSFTNLALHTAPTNDDRLLIWDSLNGTNKQTTLSGLFTNLPTVTTNGPNDYFILVTNGTPVKMTGNSFSNVLRTTLSGIIYRTNSVPLATGNMLNVPHGLGSAADIVRLSLVCTNASDGWVAGDEIEANCVSASPDSSQSDTQAFTFGGNSTNVFVSFSTTDGSGYFYTSKTGDGHSAFTPANWLAKLIAIKYP